MSHETEYAEVARARSERGEIVLRRRFDPGATAGGTEVLELRVNGVFVMDTVETTSETALARTVLDQAASPRSEAERATSTCVTSWFTSPASPGRP